MSFRGILLALLSVVAILAAVGCEETHHAKFFRTANIFPPAKADSDDVEVITVGQPSRPFRSIGIITIKEDNYERVIYFVRKLAAKVGCDAIYQIGSTTVVVRTRLYGSNATHGRFACIVWR